MAKLSGSALYVSFGGVNLSATIRNFEWTHEQETADATAGADPYRNHVTTVKNTEATCELLIQDHATGTAIHAAVKIGTSGTLLWGLEGTATGKPKGGFYAVVSQGDQSYPFDDVAVISLTFMCAGTALLFDHVTNVW